MFDLNEHLSLLIRNLYKIKILNNTEPNFITLLMDNGVNLNYVVAKLNFCVTKLRNYSRCLSKNWSFVDF